MGNGEAGKVAVQTVPRAPWARLGRGGAAEPRELLRPELAALSRYHLELSPVRFKLDQNEPPWELPEAVRRRVVERLLAESWASYPDFHADALRAAIGRHHGWPAAGVVVGNGSNELLALAMLAFLAAGERVRTVMPSFGLYPSFAAKAGVRLDPIPLAEDFSLPLDRLEAAIDEDPTVPVLLCSPNNPTGGAVSNARLARLLERLEAPLFLDGAYAELADEDPRSLLEAHPHLVIFRTFSKAWALAAARVGYLLAAPAVAEALLRVKLPYNLDRASAIAAEEALAVAPWIAERVAELRGRRARWATELAARGLAVAPSQANFLLVRCGAPAAARELFDRLEAGGVRVRDIGGYPGLAGCLRISVGTDEALAAILAVLDQEATP